MHDTERLHATARRYSSVRLFFCASFLVSWALSWGLAYSQARKTVMLESLVAGKTLFAGILDALFLQAVFASILFAGWWAIPYLGRRRLPVNWFVPIAILNIFLVTPELVLRIADFRYEPGIQYGFPRPSDFRSLKPDPNLFWTYDPSEPGVNSWGFREREILPDDKPASATRVLFLGDSCTEQGYPQSAEAILNADAPARPFECVSLALSGYSSFQGRRVAEFYGPMVNPDVVVVYYGWNDHWQAYESVDSRKEVRIPTGPVAGLRGALLQCRLFGLVLYASSRGKEIAPRREPRVSPEEYKANLLAIYRVFEPRGARVVFVTAPTSFYTLGIHDFFVERGFVADKSSGIALHKQYNEIVRDVQKQCPFSTLCDLEAAYARMPPDGMKAVFMQDGIHFTDHGLILVAYDVARAVGRVEGERLSARE